MAGGKDVLNAAVKELGVKESPANSNRVKYNTWYYGREVSGSAYPWCMAFVQWCYAQAGAKLPYKTASCSSLLNWYRKNQPECIVTEPRAGDIVIFDLPGGSATDHTGLFESLNGQYVVSIDGNTGAASDANGGAVLRRTRNKKYVAAYIRPRELEEDMSDKDIYEAVQRHAAALSVPQKMRAEFDEAVALGLCDAKDACRLVPKWQAAIMAKRAREREA